ncbi:MAG TPA: circularly permuted type 2 ATP-grasp protein, partial [Solirubrobacterales bacterium]|nr:circularly permuted type 2 ATP-grasp protein [Solirubrobacterales bacterium]
MSASGYPLEPDCLDEAFDADGTPRPHYAPLLESLGGRDLQELRRQVERGVEEHGLTFGRGEPITVDPVPRLLEAEEWERLEAGLLQRARALNAFLL